MCWGFCMGVTTWRWKNKTADGIGGSADPCVGHRVPWDLPFATYRELIAALSLAPKSPLHNTFGHLRCTMERKNLHLCILVCCLLIINSTDFGDPKSWGLHNNHQRDIKICQFIRTLQLQGPKISSQVVGGQKVFWSKLDSWYSLSYE